MTEYARIQYPNGVVRLCPMSAEDITAVAELYRSVRITARGCRERLSRDSARSFRHIGGMFRIMNRNSLFGLLVSGMDITTVAKDRKNRVVAFLWSELAPPGEAELNQIRYFDGYGHFERKLRKAREGGTLAQNREIIVAAGNSYPHVSLPLLHAQLRLLRDRGVRSLIGEVYRVVGYRHRGAEFRVDLLNEPSMAALTRSGAAHAGEAPERRLFLRGFQASIRPQIMLWDIREALEATREKMRGEDFLYHEGNEL